MTNYRTRTLGALDEIVDLFGGPLQSAVRVVDLVIELFECVQLRAQFAVDLATHLAELHHRVTELAQVLVLTRVQLVLALCLVVDVVLVVASHFVFESFVARVLTRGIDESLRLTRVNSRRGLRGGWVGEGTCTYIALIHLNAHLGLEAGEVLFERTHCAARRLNVALATLNFTALHETLALYDTCHCSQGRGTIASVIIGDV
jgi:hypothetical protein